MNSLINGFEGKLVGKKIQHIKSCLPDIQTIMKLMLLILNCNQSCSKLDSPQTKYNVTLTQFSHIYTYAAGPSAKDTKPRIGSFCLCFALLWLSELKKYLPGLKITTLRTRLVSCQLRKLRFFRITKTKWNRCRYLHWRSATNYNSGLLKLSIFWKYCFTLWVCF